MLGNFKVLTSLLLGNPQVQSSLLARLSPSEMLTKCKPDNSLEDRQSRARQTESKKKLQVTGKGKDISFLHDLNILISSHSQAFNESEIWT
jgi:hypothetical protein